MTSKLSNSLHTQHVLLENRVLLAAGDHNLLALNHFEQGVERCCTIHVHRLEAKLPFFRIFFFFADCEQDGVLLLHIICAPRIR